MGVTSDYGMILRRNVVCGQTAVSVISSFLVWKADRYGTLRGRGLEYTNGRGLSVNFQVFNMLIDRWA